MTDQLSSVLRAVRAEARRDEQNRLVDLLLTNAREDRAAAERSSVPGVTAEGRRAKHLEHAAKLIVDYGSNDWADAGECYGSVDNECDSIEVYTFDPDPASHPDGEEERKPIRIVVADGAEGVNGTAYVSVDEAEELLQLLTGALALVRERRAARAAALDPQPTWTLASGPGPEVTQMRDRDGDL